MSIQTVNDTLADIETAAKEAERLENASIVGLSVLEALRLHRGKERFIALANPATILALCARIREPAKVKPLEWTELTSPREDGPAEPTGDWEGMGACGMCMYHVYIFEDHYEVTREDGSYVETWIGDPDDAKAAAQDDYDFRIRSALITETDNG